MPWAGSVEEGEAKAARCVWNVRLSEVVEESDDGVGRAVAAGMAHRLESPGGYVGLTNVPPMGEGTFARVT